MTKVPEPGTLLNIDRIRHELNQTMFGGHIHAFNQVSSTNDVAKQLAKQGAPEGTLVVAEQQTRGRGRYSRKWSSPPFVGLWFSFVLRPKVHGENVGLVALLSSVAVAELLCESTAQVTLKWPNDVLVQGRKVCGVLGETDFHGARLSHVVLGIGLNVNQTADMFLPHLADRVISLRMAKGEIIDREQLLMNLLVRIEELYSDFSAGRFDKIVGAWKARCGQLYQQVQVREGECRHIGHIVSIDDYGRLVLRLAGGQLLTTHSTDLVPFGGEQSPSRE